MKKILLIISVSLFSLAAIAQLPQLFKYQGLARGADGNPISNTAIALRISIHQGTPTGTVVFKETHNPITNGFGSFNINIGGGTIVNGNFSTIPWGRYNFFQEVEMDVTGGTNYVTMGTSQYLSVPYALAADSARKGIAPFWVQNNFNGNDTSSVAIIAISNGEAPAIFCKNNNPFGSSFHAETSNGINFRLESDGIKTNGRSTFEGKVLMQDSLRVDGYSELSGKVYILDSMQVNSRAAFGAKVYMQDSLTVNGNVNTNGLDVNGNINVTGNIKLNGVMGTPGQVLGVNPSGNLTWMNVPNPGFSNFQVFNSAGNFTVPAGITKIMIEVWGAGGAGSGTPGAGFGGSGGGGGGYGKSIFSVSPATQYSVTIGAGGTGVINGSGNAGGASSFDVLISAFGGGGGPFGGGHGGGGSASGSAAFSIPGGTGGNGGNNSPSGSGGDGGGGGGTGAPGGGGSGTSPGGGGSGTGVPGFAGGNGGNGRVVVWW